MPKHDTKNCVKVTPGCPVEYTIYGYYPNLGVNAFFCAFFAIFTIINLVLTFRFKTFFFGYLIIFGCAGEMVGYIGRIIMHSNPWSNAGFETQICTLIFSPSFLAAGLYLTLKHMVRAIGPQFSPIKPVLYPYIFIACDFFSLLLQAVGGGLAASSNGGSGAALGGHVMLAGIVFQVATFLLLYILIIVFVTRLQRNSDTLSSDAVAILQSGKFKVFALGMLASSVFIFVRCVYRIGELSGGWANQVMRNETEYIVLDGVMCCLAVLALTVSHPGFWFPPMVWSTKSHSKVREKSESSSQEAVV